MNSRLQSRRECLFALFCLVALAGCADPPVTIPMLDGAEFDQEVNTTWKKNWLWVEGRQFLEKGGVYHDSGEPGETPYDKPKILPLMKRLASRHGVKWHAAVDKRLRNICVGMLAELPSTEEGRKGVMDSLEEEQKSFPLDILIVQGKQWMLLDFAEPEDEQLLSEAPASAR